MADRTTCRRCGKGFDKPALLKRHLGRKTPCAPILDLGYLPEDVREDPDLEKKKCRFCGRILSSYDSMRRHVRTACKIAPNAKNGDAGMEVLYSHTIRRQEARIATLDRQNEVMLGMMRRKEGMLVAQGDAARGGHQVNAGEVALADNDSVAVDNRKQQITINVFGEEGLDHVSAARIKAILDSSIAQPRQ